MVLQSQIARPQTFRKQITTRSRRRRRSRKSLVMVVAALVGLIVWIAWPGEGETPSGDLLNASSTGAQGFANANPDNVPAPVPIGQGNGSLPASGVAGQSPTPVQQPIQAGIGRVVSGANQRLTGQTGTQNPITAPPLENPLKINQGQAKGAAANNGDDAPAPVFVTPTPDQRPQLAINTEIASLKKVLANIRTFAAKTTGDAGVSMKQGMGLVSDGKYVEGRRLLSKLLWVRGAALDHRDADTVRRTLTSVNKSLVFSDRALHDDPHAEVYVVQSGDLLSRIARRYHITYQLIEQINSVDARRIRVGQKLKMIKGPFHAVVTKSAFRMDLFLQEASGSMTYVRSFPVGVGKDDSTPVGTWICRNNGKLANPGWTHPRTSKYYAPDDPANPIGEFWIALQGTDTNTKGLSGYGIHGTVEPNSIGKQASLGCIRMLKDDIAAVYKLLVDGKSTVHIQQ